MFLSINLKHKAKKQMSLYYFAARNHQIELEGID